MPVPNNITDCDPDPNLNSPPGTETAKGNIDNYLRTAFAFIRQIYNSVTTLQTNDALNVHKSGAETITGDKTLSGAKLIEARGADIVSAATINLATATGNTVHVTGAVSISAVTMSDGQRMMVIFDAALTLTHNATTNNLPNAKNITTRPGDAALYYDDGSVVYCVAYFREDGTIVGGPSFQSYGVVAATATYTVTDMGSAFDVSNAAATVQNLPALSTVAIGQIISFSNIGAGIVSITKNGTDTITGANLVAANVLALNFGEMAALIKRSSTSWGILCANVPFFGAPQTPQNLLGSRALSTSYTNSTGRTIIVSVTSSAPSPSSISLITEGITYAGMQNVASGVAYITASVSPGASYSVTHPTGTLTSWVERR